MVYSFKNVKRIKTKYERGKRVTEEEKDKLEAYVEDKESMSENGYLDDNHKKADNLLERIKDQPQLQKPEQMRTQFPIQKYEHASKTKKAQELAEWMIEEGHILPVYEDDNHTDKSYYSYDQDIGVWIEASTNYAKMVAKDQLGRNWTRHTCQEFINQIKPNENAILFSDMGLPENEILCRDGIVYNLVSEETRIVERDDYAVHQINADPDGETEIENFQEFLEDTIPKEEHRKTIQEFLGWSLQYPNSDYEKALLILGDTNSGKSTLLQVFSKLFKNSHVSRLSMTQIAQERTFHVPHLNNSLLNIDEDMSSAEIEQGSTLKKLISQEPLFVEPKGVSGFEINPRCKFMVASNVAPNPSTEDDRAFYQRFITIEAPDTVPEEEQDKQLIDKLTSEESLNGLFEWALEGMERLEEQGGFTHSPSVTDTRKKWNKYGSDVRKFVSECVEKNKSHHTPTTDAYEMYELWSMDKLGDTLSRSQFISEMKEQPEIIKGRKRMSSGSRRQVFKNVEIDLD